MIAIAHKQDKKQIHANLVFLFDYFNYSNKKKEALFICYLLYILDRFDNNDKAKDDSYFFEYFLSNLALHKPKNLSKDDEAIIDSIRAYQWVKKSEELSVSDFMSSPTILPIFFENIYYIYIFYFLSKYIFDVKFKNKKLKSIEIFEEKTSKTEYVLTIYHEDTIIEYIFDDFVYNKAKIRFVNKRYLFSQEILEEIYIFSNISFDYSKLKIISF